MDAVQRLRKASQDGARFDDTEYDLDQPEFAPSDKRVFRLSEGVPAGIPGHGEPVNFINDGSEASDVRQGGVGNCWFLAALSAIATQDQPGTEVAKLKENIMKCVLQVTKI